VSCSDYARILAEPLWLGREKVFSIYEELGSGVDWDSLPSTYFLSSSIKHFPFSIYYLFHYLISVSDFCVNGSFSGTVKACF
jgi:hypothetical protein